MRRTRRRVVGECNVPISNVLHPPHLFILFIFSSPVRVASRNVYVQFVEFYDWLFVTIFDLLL